MRENWRVFYNARTGGELLAYTIRGTFSGEEAATIDLLAKENGIRSDEVQVCTETRPHSGVFYLFDCMDGLLGEKLLTPAEVSEILYNRLDDLTEKDLIRIAANYEATLYRLEYSGGKLASEVLLYDCGY